MSRTKKILLAVVVLFLAAQLIPIDRQNPPVTGAIEAPADVLAVLERACYDCHSNETSWPWYSHLAPISLLVADDVNEGREHLNFSTWAALSAKQQAHALEELSEEVEDGEMPLWYYLPLHPEAKLSSEDTALLLAWARSTGAPK